jgi:hypothetical protein
MYDLSRFGLKEMTVCGGALRRLGEGAASMEEAAARIVDHLHDHLLAGGGAAKATALARLYVTLAFAGLDRELQERAQAALGAEPAAPETKCLVLLASRGAEPAWNSRRRSKDHQVIPLPSSSAIARAPMISRLFEQLGVDLQRLLTPEPALRIGDGGQTHNVFHVEEAKGSPFIPAQKGFVIPYGVRSAIGFGATLPLGTLFAVILFFRVPIDGATAQAFRPLSLAAKVALLPFEKRVFSPSGSREPCAGQPR